MAALLKNVSTKNKAECTGFLEVTTPRAAAMVTPANAKNKKSVIVIFFPAGYSYR
jgi:hypothetical protein